MEKYCTNCGRVFDDLNFKLCPYCGSELSTRYGRQPIPRKLRHEVFKRDGYRCRECGASKDETSLEIDHILPVAKGGTNDIDNLQTLCRECNRMKHTDEWVGGETDLEVTQNELKNLKEQIKDLEKKLEDAVTEDEKIDYEFKIMKLNEKIPIVKNNIDSLKQEKLKIIGKEKEKERKEKLFKKFYVNFDEESLNVLSEHYQINLKDKDDFIRYLVNNYKESEILEVLIAHERKNKIFDEQRLSDMYTKICPICGAALGEKIKKCSKCGHKIIKTKWVVKKSVGEILEEQRLRDKHIKICPKCGDNLGKKIKKCPKCGYKFKK